MEEANKLEEEQKEELRRVLWNYHDVFDSRPGRVKNCHCILRVKQHEPFYIKPYGVLIAKRKAVEKELEKMENWNIIERSTSEYNNPITVISQKNGDVRIVLDSRHLNKFLERETDHPESIDKLLHKFEHIKYMTSLDLTSGFHQVPLARDSRKYTAFLYNGRNYEYCMVPFGLRVSVAEFIRALDLVLGKDLLEKLTVYVDDILVTGQTWEEHISLLEEVCRRLTGGMSLKLEKCKFAVEQLKFLAHIVTEEGILPDNDKIEAIVKFPVPKTKKQLKSFFDMCEYYRKYLSTQALNAPCLNNLLKKNTVWNWSGECIQAFEEIKKQLCNSKIIYRPDLSVPFKN